MTDIQKNKLYNILSISVIFVLALSIRISYFQNTQVDNPIRGDAYNYVKYASNLVKFGTFSKDNSATPNPDAYWSPGYPVYIAGMMQLERLTGLDTYHSIIYGQAFLGALTAVLTFLLGKMFLPFRYAVIAGLFTSYSPHLISLGNYVLTESIFSFFLLTTIYSFLNACQTFSKWRFLLTGLCFSITYFINPVSFFSIFILSTLAFISLNKKHDRRLVLVTLMPALVTFLVLFSGWEIRNKINLPEDAPTSSTRLFTNLVIGSHKDYHAIWRADPRDPKNPATTDIRKLNYSYADFLKLWLERAEESPFHYLKWYFIEKPIELWGWDIHVGYGDIYVYIVGYSLYHISKPAILTYSFMYSTHYWLFGFAVAGLAFIYRDRKIQNDANFCAKTIYIILLYVSAVYTLTQADGRYSIPLRPEMYLASLYCIHKLLKYWPKKVIDKL